MERSKWQLILHEKCEDPYYEITNGTISLIANCGFVGETDEEEDSIFKSVFDALDQSGIRFHSGNVLEVNQHIEIQKLKYDYATLHAKCERYEEALKWYADEGNYFGDNGDLATAWKNKMPKKANEALSEGGGEKEPNKQIDPVELVKYIRENYKPSREVWEDNFGIALLSDEGIVSMFNQKKDKP